MKKIYNCHAHVFTNKAVPDNFLWGAVPVLGWIPYLTVLLFNPAFSKWLGRLLQNIFSFSNNDVLDRYAAFLNIGNFKSSKDIFKFLRGFYPKDTVYIIHSMDMEFMQAGKTRQTYKEQLDELAALKQKYPDLIRAFIMIDPRRGKNEIESLVKEYIEKKGFTGIKIYPLLGYYPYDERLSGVYEYAQKNNIPVAGHCAGGPVYYRKKLTPDMIDPNCPVKPEECIEPYEQFSHPLCFMEVLKKYPNLKLNIAHSGGGVQMASYLRTSWDNLAEKDKNWFAIIRKILAKYKNAYADISGGFQQSRYIYVLKVMLADKKLSNKFLFGSDYYMEETDMCEREFDMQIRALLGEKDFFKIAFDNPKKYLGE